MPRRWTGPQTVSGTFILVEYVEYDDDQKVYLSFFIFAKIANIVEYLLVNWISKIFNKERKFAVNIQPGIYSI